MLRVLAGLAVFVSVAALPLNGQGVGVFGGLAGRTSALASNSNNPGGFGWRPFIGVNSTYFTNYQDLTNTAGQVLPASDVFTTGIIGGVSGAKAWERSSLGLSYRGNIRYNTNRAQKILQNHVLALGTSHQPAARWTITTNLLGGMSSGGMGFGALFGGFGPMGGIGGFRPFPGASNPVNDALGDPEDNSLVDDEVFDSRVYFATGGASASYRVNSRLYLSGGAVGFITRRNEGQFGLNGYNIRGEASYVLNGRSNLGFYYGFADFDYHRAYGGTKLQTVTVSYNTMVTSRLNFSVFGGGVYWNSDFIGVIPLDPVLAQLLGQPTGLAIQKLNRWAAVYGVSGDYRLHATGSLVGRFRRQAFPGNGLLLGSQRSTALLGYSYTGIDRWALNSMASLSDNTGIQQTGVRIRNYAVRFNASYRFMRELHFRVGVGYRILERSGFDRGSQVMFYAGAFWSPGESPLPF